MSKIKAQKDLIANLKSTDEYKRSKAIAGCITFLSEKIKELEFEKSNLILKLDDLTKKNITQKELNSKLKSELEVQKSQNGLYKTKLTVLEELKKTFEQTVSELKNKLEKEKNDQKQRNEQYELAINKYKTTLYEIKNENKKYKKSDEVNKKLKNKIKKYEVLLYKMDLENQGYKDEIQKYQNQLSTITGQNINFIPIYKIDLNSELETIDKNKNKSENEIINDTNKIEDIENKEKFRLVKAKLPFKYGAKLGIGNLKHKKIKLFFTIIFLTISAILLGITLSANSFDIEQEHLNSLISNNCKDVSLYKYDDVVNYYELQIKNIKRELMGKEENISETLVEDKPSSEDVKQENVEVIEDSTVDEIATSATVQSNKVTETSKPKTTSTSTSTQSSTTNYSKDKNLWHLSHEGLDLEDPANEPMYDKILEMGVTPEKAPDKPTYITIHFEKGIPTAIDGK